MSVLPKQLPPRAVVTHEPIFQLTVDDYHELISTGRLTDDDPVELIEGVLVFKMPKNPPHETAITKGTYKFMRLLPDGLLLRSQAPVTLADGEPEPDFAIVRGTFSTFESRHPYPDEIVLVIEVADTTLERDRGMKLRSYARAGIGEYWIVDLQSRQLEIYRNPVRDAQTPYYRDSEMLKCDASVTVEGLGIESISVAELLP